MPRYVVERTFPDGLRIPAGGKGQGYEGGRTILDDYLREVRPLFLPRPRTFQRTSYRPGALCQFDLWEPSREVPVGALLARRRWHARLLEGGARSLGRDRPRAREAGWAAGDAGLDREGALHAGGGHPSEPFAAVCGLLAVGWRILEAKDPQSKGAVERLQGYLETSFEPGRSFANELDYQAQLDRWFDERARMLQHGGTSLQHAGCLLQEARVLALACRTPRTDPAKRSRAVCRGDRRRLATRGGAVDGAGLPVRGDARARGRGRGGGAAARAGRAAAAGSAAGGGARRAPPARAGCAWAAAGAACCDAAESGQPDPA
jgi:hypothetical protein